MGKGEGVGGHLRIPTSVNEITRKRKRKRRNVVGIFFGISFYFGFGRVSPGGIVGCRGNGFSALFYCKFALIVIGIISTKQIDDKNVISGCLFLIPLKE